MSNDDMLDAYRAGLAYVARRIKELGGDPEHPTPEQAVLVAGELLDRAMSLKAVFDPDSPKPTAEGIMRDHAKLSRQHKRRSQ